MSPKLFRFQKSHFKPATSFGLTDYSSEGVREVFEEQVLLLDVHAENPVEELAHLVVALVQGEHPRAILARRDQPHTDQPVRNVWVISGQNRTNKAKRFSNS